MHGVGPPRNLFMLGMGHTYPVPCKEPIHIVTTVLSTAFGLRIRTLQVRGKSSEKSRRFQFCFNKKTDFEAVIFSQIDHLPVGQASQNFYLPDGIFTCPGQSG